MGTITMIAETKLLAGREGCDIEMNDKGSKMLEEYLFVGKKWTMLEGKRRKICKIK